jgi:hypothetical protein
MLRNHWEDVDDVGRIIKKLDLGDLQWGCMDWIDLAEDRARWQAYVNMVMKLQVQ